MKHYHEAQNDRWHEQYLNSEKMLNEMEDALLQVEAIALKHMSNETARMEIIKIVDEALRRVLK